MTLAWPRLELEPERIGAVAFRPLGLAVLADRMRDPRKYQILDLGTAQGSNIEYFARAPCRIFIEDIYEGLRCGTWPGAGAPVAEEIQRVLVHDRNVRFDLILAWDLFDYLAPPVIKALMCHVRGYCHPGALFYMLTSTRREIPAEPARFTIRGTDCLCYEPRSTLTRDNPNHTAHAFEKMVGGFQLLHSFMLTNGLQEYVFRVG